MHVHEADLAAEEGAALGALEEALHSAAVLRRPIEEARAVGAHEMLADEGDVRARLLGRQQVR